MSEKDHSHDHAHHSHAEAKHRFLERLKGQGFKLTGKRQMIVSILLAEDRYISAKELLEQMQKTFPRLSFDTVYRNLHLLKVEGLIEESTFGDGGSKYRIACDTHDHHHHYICTLCGKTELVEGCPMDMLGITAPQGFKIESHRFEIFGQCADCHPV
ncbi:Fur family transcriptional regulator [Tumebacillus lipolyticus]|uniref:Fur family transcriptional regulator n=1 Tax=Tumebacillus lipolyticus TaxID=1280370 RepID=A0ABW5A3J3_9BACL